MSTITIPKKITKGEELIVIPRREFEEFSQWQKTVKYFVPSREELKDLRKARDDYRKGKYITLNELKRKLAIKSKS